MLSKPSRGLIVSTPEELTGFVCLPSRSDVLTLEIDAALGLLIGTPLLVGEFVSLGR
jgi:hypothetical protein